MITTEQQRKAESMVRNYLGLKRFCAAIQQSTDSRTISIHDQIQASSRDEWKRSTGILYQFIPGVFEE